MTAGPARFDATCSASLRASAFWRWSPTRPTASSTLATQTGLPPTPPSGDIDGKPLQLKVWAPLEHTWPSEQVRTATDALQASLEFVQVRLFGQRELESPRRTGWPSRHLKNKPTGRVRTARRSSMTKVVHGGVTAGSSITVSFGDMLVTRSMSNSGARATNRRPPNWPRWCAEHHRRRCPRDCPGGDNSPTRCKSRLTRFLATATIPSHEHNPNPCELPSGGHGRRCIHVEPHQRTGGVAEGLTTSSSSGAASVTTDQLMATTCRHLRDGNRIGSFRRSAVLELATVNATTGVAWRGKWRSRAATPAIMEPYWRRPQVGGRARPSAA